MHSFFFFFSIKKPQLLSIQITAGLSVIIESDYHCSDLFVVLHKTNLSSNSNLVPVSQVLFLPLSVLSAWVGARLLGQGRILSLQPESVLDP